jgi:hypothetical protein
MFVGVVDPVAGGGPVGSRRLGVLESEIAGLCGTINVATAALVDLIAEVIADGGWGGGGYRSIEHWVAVHCGLCPARAKDLCALARRVGELPETLTRFRAGRLSEDQVRPIVRHVPGEFEKSVAELAEKTTPSQIARVARDYRYDPPTDNTDKDDDNPDEGKADDEERRRRRSLSFGWDDDGNLRGAFSLPPDDGAIVKQALEASRDIVFNERTGDAPDEETNVTWADALVRLADVALGADATDRPARDRYQALIHLRTETIDDMAATELAYLHLGPAVTPRVAKYMTCDATVRIILEKAGVPVNEGHKYRTVPDKIRRIIEERDRGCRIPGCNSCRWIVVHHLVHWRDGGPTETWNLVGLCKRHHKLLHHGFYTITGNADDPCGLRFTNQYGIEIPTGPKPTPPPHPPPVGDWQHPTGEHLDTGSIWFPKAG